MDGNMRTVLYFAIFCFVVNVVGADACPKVCNACVENDWSTCNANQASQTCSTDRNSLGTTHCGSAVGTYRDKNGQEHTGVIRGCFDCADETAACFALGGALKARKFWILLKCELKCCTESKCNTQTPNLTQRAITVFKPDDAGPSQCYACAESDEKTCNEQQSIQMCATDQNSLGTTHCGSMIAKYKDTSGNEEDSFIRGCMQCLDKEDKEECFALGGALKARQNWNLLKCRLVCCINDDCNEGSSPPENAVDVFPAKECGSSASSGHQVLSSRVLALAVAFGNIVNHFC